MVEDRPSLTAVAVAFARAAVTLDPSSPARGLDPFARTLLPAPLRALVAGVAAAGTFAPRVHRALRLVSLNLVDHLELRSIVIDDVVRDGRRRGVAQLVILGAGLDARAWRLEELAGAVTFEVDHPATQRYKRQRVTERPYGEVRFVAVDFERTSLADALAAAGHDATAPTIWVWEGVTPYIAPEATAATLDIVGLRSAPGSVLGVTYATPDMLNVPPPLRPAARALLAIIGEPLRGLVTSSDMARMIRAAGLRVTSDTGVDEWVVRCGVARPPRLRVAERLAVADVR